MTTTIRSFEPHDVFGLPRGSRVGTDEEPHGSVAREVAALIRYGLPPRAAIAGASHAAHAFFGHTPADRVRFHADPALDPGTLTRPIVEDA